MSLGAEDQTGPHPRKTRTAGKGGFDRKFGPAFLSRLPTSPGIYLVYDEADRLIYVGKAKNLRRRISQYRNAKRRKKHLKMRSIVGDAARIELQECATEGDACLLELRFIQEHRPRWNLAGAFYFLYPMIGVRIDSGIASFCYTTSPEEFPEFRFHGAYRSRFLTKEAYFALMHLLSYIGHRAAKTKNSPPSGRVGKYSYVFSFRRLELRWLELLDDFLRGHSAAAVEWLVLALVENAGARSRRRAVQEQLNRLKAFWRHEALPLADACRKSGCLVYPVPQRERDVIFLKRRYLAGNAMPPAQTQP